MRRLALAALLCSGCASVDAGLSTTHRGLALVDVGLDIAIEDYRNAVRVLRLQCAAQPERESCEVAMGVSDADVLAVEQAVSLLSEGYNDTAEGLIKMQAAWAIIMPRITAVIERAKP